MPQKIVVFQVKEKKKETGRMCLPVKGERGFYREQYKWHDCVTYCYLSCHPRYNIIT